MEWEYLIRLLVATGLGIAIGFERKLRFKEAGMRTHSIVSLGACLMMLISLYAFGEGADQARVAAQIVAGVGFLGSGMIMFKRQSGIHGLTTAAGIWVTAGVGMAIGGGMYILGIGSTVIIILIQCLLHLPFEFLKTKRYVRYKIEIDNSEENAEKIKDFFSVKNFAKIVATKDGDKVIMQITLVTDKVLDVKTIDEIIKKNVYIKSIERVEDE